MKAERDDWLVVESPHTGESRRRGLVLEARGVDGGAALPGQVDGR